MNSKVNSLVKPLNKMWQSLAAGELFVIIGNPDEYEDGLLPEVRSLLQRKESFHQETIGKEIWSMVRVDRAETPLYILASSTSDGPWEDLLRSWASLLTEISIEHSISQDLVTELVKAWDRLTFLFELTKIAGRSSSLQEMLESIVESLGEVVGAGDVFLAMGKDGPAKMILSFEIGFTLPEELIEKVSKSASPISYSEVKKIFQATGKKYPDFSDLIIAPMPSSKGAYGLIGFVKQEEGEYDAGDVQLLASVAEHIGALIEASQARRTREEQERLERELSIAAEIQSNLLPIRLPEVIGCELGAHLQPARRVGGDFYDVAHLRTGEPILMLADVSGKGMPAAILTAVVHATFHGEAPYQRDPAQLLSEINRSIYPDLDKAQAFVTAAVARIDTDPLGVAYASAGHVEAAVWRSDKGWIEFLPATGLPLGVQRVLSCRSKEIALFPGDVLLLYSDGITEAENSQGEVFGAQRLSDIMEAVHSAAAAEQIPAILKAVETFCDDLPLRDDLTMILVRALEEKELTEEVIPFVISSRVSSISPFIEWAGKKISSFLAHASQSEVVDEFTLALSEVVTNQSEHAYQDNLGLIMGRLTLSSDEWRVDLYDRGEGFDPFESHDFPNTSVDPLNPEDPPIDGYGLRIVQSALDTFKYERLQDERNHWTLTKNFTGDGIE
jgi:serine phosphatase RsbU (regulator of sigma subunit)/anti-sigma regulatory factor (Ser/Thr protein kinase)